MLDPVLTYDSTPFAQSTAATPDARKDDGRTVVIGPLSCDRYLDEGIVLPGGGALNMAYHWSQLLMSFTLLSRIGDDCPELFRAFLDRHHITTNEQLVTTGVSASIDIEVQADRDVSMNNFVEGVWSSFHFSPEEHAQVVAAQRLHLVLVEPVVQEFLQVAPLWPLTSRAVSVDFLSFRRWSIERFVEVMACADIGFIGWPHAPDDRRVAALRDAAFALERLVIMTLGDKGVLVFDGRNQAHHSEHVRIVSQRVTGTTVGCGDAFIAAFLAACWDGASVRAAVEAGCVQGALTTQFQRPLPDDAYGIT
jgi:sugar/nucleoside kinase (ribokinase family)